jgi:hypothetical protein
LLLRIIYRTIVPAKTVRYYKGEGLSGSPFPGREAGALVRSWGVRFSEFASGILREVGYLAFTNHLGSL